MAEVQTDEFWLRRRESDLVAMLHEHDMSSEQIRGLIPQIHIHESEPFRPVSIEHVLQHCQLRSIRKGVLRERLVDTLEGLDAIRDDLRTSWLDPGPNALVNLNDYAEWQSAPIYVHLELLSALKGRLVCTFLFSARQAKDCWFWEEPVVLDVHTFAVEISRPAATDAWRSGTTTADKLFIEFKSHLLTAACPSVFRCLYKPLWIPTVQYLSADAAWTQISNFQSARGLNLSRLYQ